MEHGINRVNYSLARRDASKRRFETKFQEKDMQMRERANAMREKEKVGSVFSSLCQYGDYRVLGDNGYVPAVSETEVWLNGSR